MRTHNLRLIVILLFVSTLACTSGEAQKNTVTPNASPDTKPVATPSKNFTTADIAKLKWIEGTWRGMDGENPFYERYKLDGTTLIVEGLKADGSLDGEPGRFELKDGEFGKTEGDRRSAASEITDTSIQFVPAPGSKGNSFRFEKKPHGWDAILEWPSTADKAARQKVYRMEPWTPQK